MGKKAGGVAGHKCRGLIVDGLRSADGWDALYRKNMYTNELYKKLGEVVYSGLGVCKSHGMH